MGNPLLCHLPAQGLLNNPMDLQIRIPADGGGEMAVILGRKPKMTCAFRSVFRLPHRAQRKPANQRLLRRVVYFFQKLLQLLGMDILLPHLHGIAKIVDKMAQAADFFRVWHVMGTVDKRDFLPEKILRHRFIGNQHKIFYYLSSHIPLIRLNLKGFPPLVQDNLRLWEIKIYRAPPPALLPQNSRELLHELKHRHQLSILCPLRLILVLKDFPHAGISHTAVNPYHGLSYLMVHHVPFLVNGHHTA